MLEELEERQVPTVTYHGGATLPNVEVQAMYYGSDWVTNATYSAQRSQLDGFLKSVVQSSYMDLLRHAYFVGSGSFDSGQTLAVGLDKSQYLDDSTIRGSLQAYIKNGALKAPDSNRLYVVFVEDNVTVSMGGGTSHTDFLGYHGAFAGTDASGNAADIHYAVIAYPGSGWGSTAGNGFLAWLDPLNDMTLVASHELAEAVTDPNVNYKAVGWYDDNHPNPDGTVGGEVGDLTVGQTVYLNGYAVQRLADVNDQAMTPRGATSSRPVNFVLLSNGQLWEHSTSTWLNWVQVDSNVVSVSDQGIDNKGRAMVDYTTTAGKVYEFHDGSGSQWLGYGMQPKAGQGVSYVQDWLGRLQEYRDPVGSLDYEPDTGGTWSYVYTGSGIQSFDAGTDQYGVNAVDIVFSSWGAAWMVSDSDGWHFLMVGAKQVSAGQQGCAMILTPNGDAYFYNEWWGAPSLYASGVSQMTLGTDASGSNYAIGLVYTNGYAWEHTLGTNVWTYLGSGVQALAKDQFGLINVLFSNGNAADLDPSGWHFLAGSVKAVA
jgi:hypothetical protein